MKKLAHKCGVCLAEHILVAFGKVRIYSKGWLPRHGWNAHGVQHGTSGGYHTRPCPGYEKRFPHLGVSVEGAQWQLDQLISRHGQLEDAHAKIIARPTSLSYHFEYRSYDRLTGRRAPQFATYAVARDQDERHEDVVGYGPIRVPSYEACRSRQQNEIELQLAVVRRDMATYQNVVDTWLPSDPYLVEVREIVHLAAPWRRHEREVELGRRTADKVATVPACARFRSSHATGATTTNSTEINCKRCQKLLAAPVKGSVGGTRHTRPLK